MARIGVCEDEPALRRLLTRALGGAGHEVVLAHNGSEALRAFSSSSGVQAIVMDIGLPDADGRDVCQALKSGGQMAPVVFLTAYDAVHDRLAGFSAGGDDYVTKPFEIKELLARLEVLVRRSGSSVGNTAAGLVLDPTTHGVRTTVGEISLTPTEFRMLAAIMSRPGEVVRRRAVIAAGWPDGAIVSDNTVDSLMHRIRNKLAAVSSPVQVETVRGVGFRVS